MNISYILAVASEESYLGTVSCNIRSGPWWGHVEMCPTENISQTVATCSHGLQHTGPERTKLLCLGKSSVYVQKQPVCTIARATC